MTMRRVRQLINKALRKFPMNVIITSFFTEEFYKRRLNRRAAADREGGRE